MNKSRFREIAHRIAGELLARSSDLPFRIHGPDDVERAPTKGWRTDFGTIARGGPILELWRDHFVDPTRGTFYAGLRSRRVKCLKWVAEKHSRAFVTVNEDAVDDLPYVHLAHQLPSFALPVLEQYSDGLEFYGRYFPPRISDNGIVSAAVGFFESAAPTVSEVLVELDHGNGSSGSNAPSRNGYEAGGSGLRRREARHHPLQSAFVQYLERQGIFCDENMNYIDVRYRRRQKDVLVEVKPTKAGEEYYAVRESVGQLLFARHRLKLREAALEVVLNRRADNVSISFLKSLKIRLVCQTRNGFERIL